MNTRESDGGWVKARGWLLRGDVVKVATIWGVLSGHVISAIDYGNAHSPNWYIQFKDEAGGYWYFKQEVDGGEVYVPKGEVIENGK